MKRFIILASLIVLAAGVAGAEQADRIETPEASVIFELALKGRAGEVIEALPYAKEEIEGKLGWTVGPKPLVVILGGKDFRRAAYSPSTVAFADPRQWLIVLDGSRISVRPYAVGSTLRHEFCHLILHNNIKGGIPRWLNEGVCQWASGGVAEILTDPRSSGLITAVITRRLIPVERLERFPRGDEKALLLAYEQSKGLVEFIVKTYGEDGLLDILARLKRGKGIHDAVQGALGTSLWDLERGWHESMQEWPLWLEYLSANVYTFVFLAGSLILFIGFIRFLIRKRRYRLDEEEEENDTYRGGPLFEDGHDYPPPHDGYTERPAPHKGVGRRPWLFKLRGARGKRRGTDGGGNGGEGV